MCRKRVMAVQDYTVEQFPVKQIIDSIFAAKLQIERVSKGLLFEKKGASASVLHVRIPSKNILLSKIRWIDFILKHWFVK